MILGVLQARMSSTRLPGKVMADVAGEPMLGRQVERLRQSKRLQRLVLATSVDPSDDALAAFGERLGLDVVRGPLTDVLSRFVMALDRNPGAEVLVRLTGDCPLTDWRVLDATVDRHLEAGADYTSNVSPRTFPHGLDVEVVRAQALRAAGSEATSGHDREHVMPFLYGHPERFSLASITRTPSLAHLRWTVDLPEDLVFVRHVYETLYPMDPDFGTEAIAALDWNSSRAKG